MSKLMLVLAAAVAADDDASKKDLDALQGTWRAEKFIIDGTALPPEANERTRLVITGGRMTIHTGKTQIEDATVKLDATKKPGSIDIMPEGKKVKAYGIYEVKGDSAKLCFRPLGKRRPTEFTSEKDSEVILMVLKREKK